MENIKTVEVSLVYYDHAEHELVVFGYYAGIEYGNHLFLAHESRDIGIRGMEYVVIGKRFVCDNPDSLSIFNPDAYYRFFMGNEEFVEEMLPSNPMMPALKKYLAERKQVS